mgnify:CR=1 FL=1
MECSTKIMDGIPIIECAPEPSIPYQGVFFFVHGHTCSKELWYFGSLAERICKMGFRIVSIDAYKHGQRIEEPYLSKDPIAMTEAMISVILKTSNELRDLYEKHYRKMGGKLGILGISMGGHIAYQMVKRLPHIDILIPLIGAPDIRRHYYDSKIELLGKERLNKLEPFFEEAEIPYRDFAHVENGLMMVGANDHVVLPDNSKDYFQMYLKPNFAQLTLQTYPVGHEVTKDMENEIERYLKNDVLKQE